MPDQFLSSIPVRRTGLAATHVDDRGLRLRAMIKLVFLGRLADLAGGGEMGALMRAHDWSSSPLGPPEGWPQSLRTAVVVSAAENWLELMTCQP